MPRSDDGCERGSGCVLTAAAEEGRTDDREPEELVTVNLNSEAYGIEAFSYEGIDEAVALLSYAKDNELDYRKLYDSKQMPTQSFVESKMPFTDTETPANVLLNRLQAAKAGGTAASTPAASGC